MKLLCIDPGTTHSGYVVYDGNKIYALNSDMPNETLAQLLSRRFPLYEDDPLYTSEHMAIEMLACFGMAVGSSTLETAVWVGRFIEAFGVKKCTRIYRKEVMLNLCNCRNAKPKNIRRALLDRFPATGGGKTPEIGTKKQPGPLYGVTSHSLSALAVGITYFDKKEQEKNV